MRNLTSSLCSSVGSLTNASKIARTVSTAKGKNVDSETISLYLKYLEDKHDGATEELTQTANANGEYFKADEAAGTITINAMKFSDYAIAYEEESGGWHPIIPIIPIIPIGPIVPVDKYYTVSFDMQGIGDAIDPITVQKGAKLAVQDTPVAEGYEFGGWFKEAECTNAWDFDKDTVKSNMTLYAKWTKIVEPKKVSVLLVKGAKSGDKAVKLSWNKVDGATKYVVYGNSCGKDFKKLKTTTGKTYTVKKIAGKKLVAHKFYKFRVVAYTADGMVKSKTIHFITANTKGKYANVKSIKAKASTLQLAVGEFGKVGATYKMYSGKKHLGTNHGKALRYISDNPEVVSVSSTGKVLARQAGTATIYIQDVGGKYVKTVVTVKAADTNK